MCWSILLRRSAGEPVVVPPFSPPVLQGPGAKMLGNVDLSWLAGVVVARGLYAVLGSRRRQEPWAAVPEKQPEPARRD